jgi:hypothetical protein
MYHGDQFAHACRYYVAVWLQQILVVKHSQKCTAVAAVTLRYMPGGKFARKARNPGRVISSGLAGLPAGTGIC